MTAITANGIQLEYEERGSQHNVPLILIRGLGTQLIDWPDSLIIGLADEGFRVIYFDNRDVGLSQNFNSYGRPDMRSIFQGDLGSLAYTLQDMAEDVIGLMDTLGVESAHIFGISMGGMIVQLMAAAYGDRVKSMISVMSSSGRPGLPESAPEAQAALTESIDPQAGKDAIVKKIAEDLKIFGSPVYPESEAARIALATRRVERNYNADGIARQMAAVVASGSRVDILKTINVPSLVIHGADDPLIPLAAGKDTAACIPACRLEVIPGMGHNIPDALVLKIIELINNHIEL